LAERRKDLGLYQKQIAQACSTSQQHYQRMEKGAPIKSDTLERAARALHSDVMLIPKEKTDFVRALLAGDPTEATMCILAQLVAISNSPVKLAG
jgi:transcriptional regulator with XRE-family HTH domain